MEFGIVTSNKKIIVSAWAEAQNPIVLEKRAPRRFWPPSVIGLAGTLLLHSLALQTVVMGTRTKIRPPEVQEPRSSLSKPAETLVIIDIPKTPHTDNEFDGALASVRAVIKDIPISETNLDPSPPHDIETLALSDDKDSTSSVESGDGADRARLFGIYSRQIQARIDRVWRRPRTAVNERSDASKALAVEYFQCQVQIVQDSSGNVHEILLPNCNGSVAWQRSLVMAIQQASPLPAPPSPSVFSRSVVLNFVAYAYMAGGSDEGYEAKSEAVARADVNQVSTGAQISSTVPTEGTLQ